MNTFLKTRLSRPLLLSMLLLASIVATACGQRGPLYLPEEQNTPSEVTGVESDDEDS